MQTLKIDGHTDASEGLSWAPEGRRLATASQDGTIRIFDARLGFERSGIAVIADP
ncbi:MAG: hypothetical protein KDA92_11545 [Planctomycetales bacterium]|nr:hypothetical protein [Planctomycetales bacterium]MCA9169404.1 hypothetical protein [Planctomycetales bacterium]